MPKTKFVAAFAVSLALLAAVLWYTGVFAPDLPPDELYRRLCDSFFTVGAGYLCAALLTLAAKNGTFNFFSYNGRLFASAVMPQFREPKRTPYHEYIEQRASARQSWQVWHLLTVAAVHCVVAAVMLALWYVNS